MNLQFITSDINAVRRVLANGCRWVVYEPKDPEAVSLASEAVRLCRESEAVLIIKDDAALCETVKADGVLLSSPDAVGATRRQLGEEPLIGALCADLDSVKKSRAGGADYIDAGSFEHFTPEELRQLVLALYEADIPLPICIGGAVSVDDIPTISATGVRAIVTCNEAFFTRDIWRVIDKLS